MSSPGHRRRRNGPKRERRHAAKNQLEEGGEDSDYEEDEDREGHSAGDKYGSLSNFRQTPYELQ